MKDLIIKPISIFIILLLLATNFAKAQKDLKPIVPIEKVDELFKNWNNSEKPGIAVGIVSNGDIVHTKGYGMANLEFDIPITAETRFYIGELSNQFTAMAILLLEADSKLSLQDDIRKYLPAYPDLGQRIAIEDLINHSSGIRDIAVTKALSGWGNSEEVSADQTMQFFTSQQQLNSDPGKKHQENISAFLLLEKIIAKASGVSYTEYIQKNIFDPLQMTNTFFDTASGAIIKNKATGYYPEGEGFTAGNLHEMDLYNTNVYSTVGDISLWLQNYYRPKVGNTALIKRFTAAATLNDQPVEEKMNSLYVNQFRYWDYSGTKKLYHISVSGGYACKIVHFPDQNMSAVVLGNGGTYNGGMATLTGKLYVENYFTKPAELVKVKGIDMDTKALERFTGDYWNPSQLYNRSILLKNDTLIYSRGGNYNSPIIPIEKNKFQMIHYKPVFITFENKNNKNIMFVEAEGEGAFDHIAYQKDAPWTKDLAEFTGEFFCQELKTRYQLSIKEDKLMVTNLRTGDIELSPTLKDAFTGNRRYFNELKFDRNDKMDIKGFQLATSSGDKLWFERMPASIAKTAKVN